MALVATICSSAPPPLLPPRSHSSPAWPCRRASGPRFSTTYWASALRSSFRAVGCAAAHPSSCRGRCWSRPQSLAKVLCGACACPPPNSDMSRAQTFPTPFKSKLNDSLYIAWGFLGCSLIARSAPRPWAAVRAVLAMFLAHSEPCSCPGSRCAGCQPLGLSCQQVLTTPELRLRPLCAVCALSRRLHPGTSWSVLKTSTGDPFALTSPSVVGGGTISSPPWAPAQHSEKTEATKRRHDAHLHEAQGRIMRR